MDHHSIQEHDRPGSCIPSCFFAMTILPKTSRSDILAFQFSSWYPAFASSSIKSTIIRPLSTEFVEYLNADGVVVPEGSGLENTSVGIDPFLKSSKIMTV